MQFIIENIEISSFLNFEKEIKEYIGEGCFNETWQFGYKEEQNSIFSSNEKGDPPGTIRAGYPESASPLHIMEVRYPEFIPKMLNYIHRYFSFRGKHSPFPLSEITLVYTSSSEPHISLSNRYKKVSGKVTEFNLAAWYLTKQYSIDDFIFKISDNEEYFKILPEQPYSVSFALNIVIAYSTQGVIEIYIDQKENKVFYVSLPYTLLNFVYEMKLKKYISEIQPAKLDILKEYTSKKERLSRCIVEDILNNLERQTSSSINLCYIITKEECFWGYYHHSLNPELKLIAKRGEIPKTYLIKLNTTNIRESIQLLIENGNKAGIGLAIVPEFIIDYTKKTIHFEQTYWHSKKIKEVENWTITKCHLHQLIPEEDRYWILDGKNWLHEIFGNEFSELFFFE